MESQMRWPASDFIFIFLSFFLGGKIENFFIKKLFKIYGDYKVE